MVEGAIGCGSRIKNSFGHQRMAYGTWQMENRESGWSKLSYEAEDGNEEGGRWVKDGDGD